MDTFKDMSLGWQILILASVAAFCQIFYCLVF